MPLTQTELDLVRNLNDLTTDTIAEHDLPLIRKYFRAAHTLLEDAVSDDGKYYNVTDSQQYVENLCDEAWAILSAQHNYPTLTKHLAPGLEKVVAELRATFVKGYPQTP